MDLFCLALLPKNLIIIIIFYCKKKNHIKGELVYHIKKTDIDKLYRLSIYIVYSSHIKLYSKTGCPLKLSRVELVEDLQ